MEVIQRLQGVGKIEGSGHVELLDRSSRVEQLQQFDLGGAQIDQGRLDLRFILHTEKFDAVQIDLGNVAGVEAVAADVDDVVVVGEVGFG